jgi:hypothetical protein
MATVSAPPSQTALRRRRGDLNTVKDISLVLYPTGDNVGRGKVDGRGAPRVILCTETEEGGTK